MQTQPPEVFYEKSVRRTFTKFTEEHLCQSLFFNKDALAQEFSCEFYEISKRTFSTEHLQTTASDNDRKKVDLLCLRCK